MGAELACTYASLILHDADLGVTAEKIVALNKAAGVDVQPIWASIFARVLATCDLEDLIMASGSGGGGGGGGGAAPAAAADDAAPAAEKKEEKKEEKSESSEEMGFGLFD